MLSVIVPARDAAATLPRLLASLAAQRGDVAFELIVVDNGSHDETAKIAEAAGARVVRRSRGEGPGPARDAGVGLSSADAFAFIDADCFAAEDWLAAGAAALRSAALVQGRVIPDPGVAAGPFDRSLTVSGASALFESANLFVARELFERVGGFGAGLEAPGEGPFGEDVVFGWRARRTGVQVAFCADALVYHAVMRRGCVGYISERRRRGLFCDLVAETPELREHLFYGGVFLARRSAAFDLALLGMIAAVARRSSLPLVCSVPYACLSARAVRPWGGRLALRVGVADGLADAVGCLALARGSLRTRRLVL